VCRPQEQASGRARTVRLALEFQRADELVFGDGERAEVQRAGELVFGDGERAEAHVMFFGYLLGGERSPRPQGRRWHELGR